MRLIRGFLAFLLSVIILVAAVGGDGYLYLTRRAFPQTDGTVQAAGLAAPATVIRDKNGIPHIYAANIHDLFFAQGYVQAQDRLWQMEANRRGVDLSAFSNSAAYQGRMPDPCSLLTKEEASEIAGLTIERTEEHDRTCDYYAQPVSPAQQQERMRKALGG